VRSQRMASSISCGVRPYSSASAAMASRALKRDAIIAVMLTVGRAKSNHRLLSGRLLAVDVP
jgi:hypothetical protein